MHSGGLSLRGDLKRSPRSESTPSARTPPAVGAHRRHLKDRPAVLAHHSTQARLIRSQLTTRSPRSLTPPLYASPSHPQSGKVRLQLPRFFCGAILDLGSRGLTTPIFYPPTPPPPSGGGGGPPPGDPARPPGGRPGRKGLRHLILAAPPNPDRRQVKDQRVSNCGAIFPPPSPPFHLSPLFLMGRGGLSSKNQLQ